MSFFEFPHTRTYDSDLGFIIRFIKKMMGSQETIEEWISHHQEEYNELLQRMNNILPEIRDILPAYVMDEVNEQLERGIFQNLIINTAAMVAERYINELYDITNIEALQATNGDYIFTTTGEYIFVSAKGESPTAYTTNIISNFYDELKDKTNKVKEGKKPLNDSSWGYLSKPPVLTLMHVSDYHGDGDELEYIYNKWSSVLALADDYICTGDMVEDRFNDPFVYYPTTDNPMARATMLTIGNHDALAAGSGYDWTDLATQAQEYNKFFAPTINYWGVIHSGTNTYYYKDYNNSGIRLIVLNDMLQGADMLAQLYWLETTALNTNYSVIIAKHYMPPTPTKINCTFTSIDNTSNGHGETGIADRVQQFINNGGKFICYLCGHSHYDYVAYLSQYPAQLIITMDATGRRACNQWSDVQRYDDEISRDLFNMIQFDTSCSTIKITRCGANYDRYLRHKNTLSINYQTKQIYSE